MVFDFQGISRFVQQNKLQGVVFLLFDGFCKEFAPKCGYLFALSSNSYLGSNPQDAGSWQMKVYSIGFPKPKNIRILLVTRNPHPGSKVNPNYNL